MLSRESLSVPSPQRVGWAIYAALLIAGLTSAAQAAEADPLAYVPTNAGGFAHLRVGDLWRSSLAADTRKALGKDFDKVLDQFEKESGLRLEAIETVTFFYPTWPMEDNEETTFIAIFTTNKPYDPDTLLKRVRPEAEVKNGFVSITNNLLLHFTSANSFAILHETLVEKFKKGPLNEPKEGVLSEALQLAREKHHFVLAIDLSQLPKEFFTNPSPELQSFLPLLKARSSTFFADLKDKDFTASLNFTSANANAAQEAERSFKLLLRLATDGLSNLLKDDKIKKEIGHLLPALKELDRSVNAVKVNLIGNRLETSLALKANMPIVAVMKDSIDKINQNAMRASNMNNLRQIALAMHNYHNANNGLPPATICDKKGKPLLSWRVAILPHIEGMNLYKQFKLDEPWDSEHNKKLIDHMPKTYTLPGEKMADGRTHYRVFVGNGAAFDLIQQTKFMEITDGLSNTILVVDTAEGTPWTKPDDIDYDPKQPIEKLLRFVNGRTAVTFCDGSVQLLKQGLAEKTWHFLIRKNDGHVIELPDD